MNKYESLVIKINFLPLKDTTKKVKDNPQGENIHSTYT